MIITTLEKIDNKKFKVYVDYEYVFILYITDIKKNELKEGKEITQDKYNELIINTVLRRSKQKALSILKYMDRTEKELRDKLRQSMYADNIIDMTMEYVMSYGYINDERYVHSYVENKKSVKSRQQIISELLGKGISKEIINKAVDEISDEGAIVKAIRKKTDNVDELSFEERNKLAAHLYRKGFKSDDIKKFIR